MQSTVYTEWKYLYSQMAFVSNYQIFAQLLILDSKIIYSIKYMY